MGGGAAWGSWRRDGGRGRTTGAAGRKKGRSRANTPQDQCYDISNNNPTCPQQLLMAATVCVLRQPAPSSAATAPPTHAHLPKHLRYLWRCYEVPSTTEDVTAHVKAALGAGQAVLQRRAVVGGACAWLCSGGSGLCACTAAVMTCVRRHRA